PLKRHPVCRPGGLAGSEKRAVLPCPLSCRPGFGLGPGPSHARRAMLPQIPFLTPHDLELMGRVLVSFLLGAVLGFERERTGRPAGLRTHMLVCAGPACFTV